MTKATTGSKYLELRAAEEIMTSIANELPPRVVDMLRGTLNSEFATVTGQNVPIDTPMIFFPNDDLSAFNVGTGLAYPAKAERARRNPKVGLLLEGRRDEPVVAICGRAAVRDSDIQANTDLYLSETAFMRVGLEPWPNAKRALWYWTRMIVSIAPARILWWDSRSSMDRQPQRWSAPADTVFPASDPAPQASPSTAPSRPAAAWRELATAPLDLKLPGHLTLCDREGYPLPMRASTIALVDEGFVMKVPTGAPWHRAGKATLSFMGRETFVGEVFADGDLTRLRVDRALPINPFMGDPREVWDPSPEVHAAMMGRLAQELARRGQPLPTVPDEEPFPTSVCGKLRQARMAAPMQGLPAME
jgi:hypothetical protein